MTRFKRWFFRSVSISVLSMVISLLIGAYTTVAYAEQSVPSENQTAALSEISSIESDLDEGETGKAPEQLSEQAQELLDNSATSIIVGYEEFSEVALLEDEQIFDLDLLKNSSKLPNKAVLYISNNEDNSTTKVDITDWLGSFDGVQAGRYVLTAVWQLPDGYIKHEELDSLTIEVVVETPQTNPAVIGVTSDTEINDSNSEDLYTVIGSEDKDVIEIISLEGGIIQITVTNDDGTYTYKLSNKMKIVVDGKDGDDNIYFNLTGKSNGLTNLVILGGAGSDTVTTGLAAGQAIDLTGTDILLKAEKVLFDITGQNDQALKLKANNLTVNAAPTEA